MSERQSWEKPRHLYLVLDDWSRGYSIRKINLSPEDIRPPLIPADVVRGDAIFAGRYTLPSALFRFEGRRGEPKSIVGAFGNKVLACLPLTHGESLANIVRIFDVHTRISSLRPWPRLDFFNAIHIPIGGRIFALSSDSFNLLNLADDDANWDNVWLCFKLAKPTFRCDLITSYAVHPDKHTIFVSSVDESGVPATFTFETLESMVWRLHGMWQLPFSGRGYFVPKLGALVGLSGDRNTIGHICSCVVSTNSVECSDLKLSKEKLFSVVPGERHIGATLVYMGYETKFCLLEGICVDADQLSDSDENNETEFDNKRNKSYIDYFNETDSDEIIEESVDEVNQELDQKRCLRLTTFSLRYDRNGYLTIGDSCRVWYYNVSTEVTEALLRYPVAFWM